MKTRFLLKAITGCFIISSMFTTAGCDDYNPIEDENTGNEDQEQGTDNSNSDTKPMFEWISDVEEDTPILLVGKVSLSFKADNVENITVKDVPENWEININMEQAEINVIPPANGNALPTTLTFIASGTDGTEKEIKATFQAYPASSFDNPQGAFVLNEGNMTTENSSLIYITPDGQIIDDVYKQVNGTELGNVCQDMAFCNGKIYIISQNGNENEMGNAFNNDGMLIVLNAKTLKKEKSFTNAQLSDLDWPSHIAVTDAAHAYIRDNKGVWCLNTETGDLNFIEGTKGALKTHFVTDGNMVYALNSNEGGYSPSNLLTITDKSLIKSEKMGMFYEYHDIQYAGNNQLWGICSYSFMGDSPTFSINKIDISKPSRSQEAYSLNELPSAGTSGHYFSVYNNMVYFIVGTSIYSRELNGKDTEINGTPIQPTKLIDLYDLDDNAIQQYNGLYINPINGYLYVNTIKGMGNFYTTNTIWVFDTNGNMQQPLYRFNNYTRFPAGIFFPPQNNN